MSRRTLAGATVLTVVTGLTLLVTMTSGGSQSHGAVAGRPAGTLLTTVRKRSLSAQLDVTGTVEYTAQPGGSPYTVVNRASGALTSLPGAGQVIAQGQVLYRVDGKPVVLLDGSTPAYRTLTEGDTGADVRQLNADLVALGYATRGELDPTSDYFSSQTAYALDRLQGHLGMQKTGSLELGQAVFLPAPLRITKVIGTVGRGASANPGSGPGSSQGTSAITRPHAVFVSLTVTQTTRATSPSERRCRGAQTPVGGGQTPTGGGQTPTDGADATRKRHKCKPGNRRHHKPHEQHAHRPGHHKRAKHKPPTAAGGRPGTGSRSPAAPKNQGSGPSASNSHGGGAANPGGGSHGPGAGNGSGTPPAQPILEATSTRRQVMVKLDANERSRVRVGDRALITLPDGRTTPGLVTRIGTVASSDGNDSGSGSSSATVPICISLEWPQAAGSLDLAPVQVQITTATVRKTLAVPVTALVGLAHGRYGVETIDTRGARRVVPVRVGLFDDAQGLVQVASPTLTAGQQILVPASGGTALARSSTQQRRPLLADSTISSRRVWVD